MHSARILLCGIILIGCASDKPAPQKQKIRPHAISRNDPTPPSSRVNSSPRDEELGPGLCRRLMSLEVGDDVSLHPLERDDETGLCFVIQRSAQSSCVDSCGRTENNDVIENKYTTPILMRILYKNSGAWSAGDAISSYELVERQVNGKIEKSYVDVRTLNVGGNVGVFVVKTKGISKVKKTIYSVTSVGVESVMTATEDVRLHVQSGDKPHNIRVQFRESETILRWNGGAYADTSDGND